MLINDIPISSFNTKLLKKDIQTAEIIIYDDWLRNALNPLYIGKEIKYKAIKVQLLIQETDDESALDRISYLVKELTRCTIKFEDLSYFYDCTIENKNHARVVKGIYELNVDLKSGYAYKPEITENVNRISNKTINVSGNLNTPAIVEITPTVDVIDIVITGLGNPFTIKNLTADQTVIIDGEKGLVTENGQNKYGDYDGWEFPVLRPGANTITFSRDNCDIKIKYKPRWI